MPVLAMEQFLSDEPPPPSLMKFDEPEEVSKRGRLKTTKKSTSVQEVGKASNQSEELLNSIFPKRSPKRRCKYHNSDNLAFFREWMADGQHWLQKPSRNPASRLDVINLQV